MNTTEARELLLEFQEIQETVRQCHLESEQELEAYQEKLMSEIRSLSRFVSDWSDNLRIQVSSDRALVGDDHPRAVLLRSYERAEHRRKLVFKSLERVHFYVSEEQDLDIFEFKKVAKFTESVSEQTLDGH